MADIMSRTVERTGNDARPLVKVYTKPRLRALFAAFDGHPDRAAPDFAGARASPAAAAAAGRRAARRLESDYQGAKAGARVMRERGRAAARAAAPPAAAGRAHPASRRADGPTSWPRRASRRPSGSPARPSEPPCSSICRTRASIACAGRHPDLVRATIDAAARVLRHEFDLLGSGPYTPVDPDRPADASGYRPIDWYLDPVSGLRFPRGVPLARLEPRADAAGPRRHQAAVGARPLPALAAARPGLSPDRRRSLRASRSRASCATSWTPIRSASASTGPARWTSRCGRRTGRSRSNWSGRARP